MTQMDDPSASVVKILCAIARLDDDTEIYKLQKRTRNFIDGAERTMPQTEGQVSGATCAIDHENWHIAYCCKALETCGTSTSKFPHFHDQSIRKQQKRALSAQKMASN